jgi:hypothetical protein
MRASTCRPIWRPPARRGAADAQGAQDPDLDLGADRDLRGCTGRLHHGQAVVGVDRRHAGASRAACADDAGADVAAAWHEFSRQPESLAVVGLGIVLGSDFTIVVGLGFAFNVGFSLVAGTKAALRLAVGVGSVAALTGFAPSQLSRSAAKPVRTRPSHLINATLDPKWSLSRPLCGLWVWESDPMSPGRSRAAGAGRGSVLAGEQRVAGQ